jgi:predicted small lipoprotein YifL
MSLRKLLIASATLAVAASPLAACGKLGELEKPGLNRANRGSNDRQAEEQRRQAQDPQRPVDTVDPRDRSTDPAPPRTLPIAGSGQPSAMPPTALSNPYNNPR